MEPFNPQNQPPKRPYPKRMTYLDGYRLYPSAVIQHHIQGFLAGASILGGNPNQMAFGLAWTFLYVAYQALSWIRKKDSPALDITDYMVGMFIPMPIAGAYQWIQIIVGVS